MNITNFMTWFIQQFINIGSNMLGLLDRIQIYSNVTLLDFIITIAIIGAFISIIITSPALRTGQEIVDNRRKAQQAEEKRYNDWWESKR